MSQTLPTPRVLSTSHHVLRAGMVGLGMIFDETYRPFFEAVHARPLYDPAFGVCEVELAAVASRTGSRAEAYRKSAAGRIGDFASFTEPDSIGQMLRGQESGGRGQESGVRSQKSGGGVERRSLTPGPDFVCVATPDDRHFEAAKAAARGRQARADREAVRPARCRSSTSWIALAREKGVLAKVVYHKLLDPDHKKLRTLVADGVLQHVNNGYCSLLEPKSITGGQFAEWITGRNPGTYVAVPLHQADRLHVRRPAEDA